MNELTLNNLFFPTDPDAGGDALAESIRGQGAESLVALKGELKQQLPKLSFKVVEKEITAKIGEVLDVGFQELLVSGWKKYQEFQAYADPELHPPEETILVPLAEHTIQSAHQPRVDLMVKDFLLGSIGLDVQLSLALEGVVLKIQGGKILEIRAGSCQAAGSLKATLTSKVGEKELLALDRETPQFQLGEALKLGSGVAIPRLAAAGTEAGNRIIEALEEGTG